MLNETSEPHPFHIHINEFQVMSVNDQPYDVTGMQDVVSIPPRINQGPPGKVVIRTQFKDFPGWFVFHCHILGHEDDGMMQSIQVLGFPPNAQPPIPYALPPDERGPHRSHTASMSGR